MGQFEKISGSILKNTLFSSKYKQFTQYIWQNLSIFCLFLNFSLAFGVKIADNIDERLS